MIVRLAVVHVKANKIEVAAAFQVAARERLKQLPKLFHQIFQGIDDPTMFLHLVGFETEEQLEKYLSSGEFERVISDPNGVTSWRDDSSTRIQARMKSL